MVLFKKAASYKFICRFHLEGRLFHIKVNTDRKTQRKIKDIDNVCK